MAGVIIAQNAISGVVEAFYDVVPKVVLGGERVGEEDGGSGGFIGVSELVRDGPSGRERETRHLVFSFCCCDRCCFIYSLVSDGCSARSKCSER